MNNTDSVLFFSSSEVPHFFVFFLSARMDAVDDLTAVRCVAIVCNQRYDAPRRMLLQLLRRFATSHERVVFDWLGLSDGLYRKVGVHPDAIYRKLSPKIAQRLLSQHLAVDDFNAATERAAMARLAVR